MNNIGPHIAELVFFIFILLFTGIFCFIFCEAEKSLLSINKGLLTHQLLPQKYPWHLILVIMAWRWWWNFKKGGEMLNLNINLDTLERIWYLTSALVSCYIIETTNRSFSQKIDLFFIYLSISKPDPGKMFAIYT